MADDELEVWVVDMMAVFFRRNDVLNFVCKVAVGRASSQQAAQVMVEPREQARPNLTIGCQPDATTLAAKRL